MKGEPSAPSSLDQQVLAKERKSLYAYAMMRLRDPDLAEDAVQETLISALQSLDRFEQRSSVRTWLMAILRNKIVDLLRSRGRELTLLDDEEPEPDDDEAFFRPDGHWDSSTAPRPWSHPEAAMEQREFWGVFEQCLRLLPARTGEVFFLREIVGEPIEAICKNLAISSTNCSVMLFRARARLRACLEQKWFAV